MVDSDSLGLIPRGPSSQTRIETFTHFLFEIFKVVIRAKNLSTGRAAYKFCTYRLVGR